MRYIKACTIKSSHWCNCLNVRRASRSVTQFYDRVLEPSGLKVTQFSLLKHVEQLGPIAISELAKEVRIDRTTLNRNMKPLEDAGLIVISPGRDSRIKEVALSDAGKRAVAEGWALWEEAQCDIKEYLGEKDLATLVELLSKLEALTP
ncbi:winged helix-turn-helix transcriptional regulator [bacterium BFN5]|nr:winged helix-turn-helix transcriptional regulator [bacterium BFN5]